MFQFETDCAKFDEHNTAINLETKSIDQWPTIRIKTSEDHYKLGLTLYKFQLEPSGNALVVYGIKQDLHKDDLIWTIPNESEQLKNLQLKLKSEIEKFKKELDIVGFIEDVSNGITKENIEIYKYHASQWRPIEKKKTKWVYKEKAIKSDTCNIQRLLN